MPNVIVTTKGPLFDGRAPQIVHREAQAIVQELVELGEQRLDQMLRPRPAGVYLSVAEAQKGQASTGNYRRNISGMVRDLNGLITDGGVIYGPWLEGVGSRNASTRFKGYASFRRTAQWLEQQVPKVIRVRVDRMVARLNGGG